MKIYKISQDNSSIFNLPNPTFIDSLREDGNEVEVKMMSPDEYLDRIAEGFWLGMSNKYATLEEYRENIDERISNSQLEKYKEAALKGAKFPTPSIFYSHGKMESQEGHHRVEVARQLEIEAIPVLIVNGKYRNTIVTNRYDPDLDMFSEYIVNGLSWESCRSKFHHIMSDISNKQFNNDNLNLWYDSLIETFVENNANKVKDRNLIFEFLVNEEGEDANLILKFIANEKGKDLNALDTGDLWNFLTDNYIDGSYINYILPKISEFTKNVYDYLLKQQLVDRFYVLTDKGFNFFLFNKNKYVRNCFNLTKFSEEIVKYLSKKERLELTKEIQSAVAKKDYSF